MKAWVLHNINDFRWETVEDPAIKEDEVLLNVKAAGICGSDIPRIFYTGTYSYPLIPGHEFAGIVAAVGKNVSSEWMNRRVGVFPLIPCHSCGPCQNGQYEMCRHYSYLGSRRNGAFAEYVSVPAENLIELPKEVSYEQAAMLEPMAVAVHAMRRAAVKTDDSIAICGLGTIGLLLLQFLMDMRKQQNLGMDKVFVIGNKDFQKKTIINMGISLNCYCDSRHQDVNEWIAEHTDGAGVNVFFECVGKNATLSQAVNVAAPAGTIVTVGNPASDMTLEKNIYWKILRNQLTIKGTWNSSFIHDPKDDWHYVLNRLLANAVEPQTLITHRFPLERLQEGLHIMRDRTEDYVKIMGVNWESGE